MAVMQFCIAHGVFWGSMSEQSTKREGPTPTGRSLSASSAEALAADGVPGPGELIAGKFCVERVLGEGGMGVVVAARHVQIDQRVAVKFLRSELVREPTASARFLREVRAAGALRGTNLARVMDVGVSEAGLPYMIMEYLAGRDLGDVLAERGPLTIVDA